MTCSSCGTMFNCADTRRQPELSETRRYIVSRVKGFTISSVRGGWKKTMSRTSRKCLKLTIFFAILWKQKVACPVARVSGPIWTTHRKLLGNTFLFAPSLIQNIPFFTLSPPHILPFSSRSPPRDHKARDGNSEGTRTEGHQLVQHCCR